MYSRTPANYDEEAVCACSIKLCNIKVRQCCFCILKNILYPKNSKRPGYSRAFFVESHKEEETEDSKEGGDD